MECWTSVLGLAEHGGFVDLDFADVYVVLFFVFDLKKNDSLMTPPRLPQLYRQPYCTKEVLPVQEAPMTNNTLKLF